jgi:hypothetical protein
MERSALSRTSADRRGSAIQRKRRRGSCWPNSLREGIAQSQYYSWSKEFLEAGKKRLAGDPILIAKLEKEKSTYS